MGHLTGYLRKFQEREIHTYLDNSIMLNPDTKLITAARDCATGNNFQLTDREIETIVFNYVQKHKVR